MLKNIANCKHKSPALSLAKKWGMDTGLSVIHPITQKALPLWVANFVVMDYGSGAVMSVPAHDQRDYEFAKKYKLPILKVIDPMPEAEVNPNKAFTGDGILINSGQFSGLTSKEAIEAIGHHLETKKLGKKSTHYRLRDWGVSRQRFWGTPIPIIHCAACGAVPIPEADLPLKLPENITVDDKVPPLSELPEFYETTCPTCQKPAKRDTDTFDTFVESSWYYVRYTAPELTSALLDERANHWLPVDQYIGGIEHAVMHLLYARFFS